jgi:hypothetical protein
VRKSARKGNTKVARAERSAPDQSHQKMAGSPPTCEAKKFPRRLDMDAHLAREGSEAL